MSENQAGLILDPIFSDALQTKLILEGVVEAEAPIRAPASARVLQNCFLSILAYGKPRIYTSDPTLIAKPSDLASTGLVEVQEGSPFSWWLPRLGYFQYPSRSLSLDARAWSCLGAEPHLVSHAPTTCRKNFTYKTVD